VKGLKGMSGLDGRRERAEEREGLERRKGGCTRERAGGRELEAVRALEGQLTF